MKSRLAEALAGMICLAAMPATAIIRAEGR